jgi:FtsZ-interacting cell division protein ZipA
LADELRWILGGLGLVLIGGILWWGIRRSAQTPAGGELRQSEFAPVPPPPPPPAPAAPRQGGTEWGVSPLEPLSIRTDDFDDVPVLDLPLRADRAEPAPAPEPLRAAPASPHEEQKIVTLRVTAPGGVRWSGRQLLAALEQQELRFGRYRVFHRQVADGTTLFCIASLIEPGTFDLEAMPAQEFRGITAFAVLPGPVDPLQTWDALVACVRGLAESLSGMAQDAEGLPLTPLRAAALRDEVARFDAQRG